MRSDCWVNVKIDVISQKSSLPYDWPASSLSSRATDTGEIDIKCPRRIQIDEPNPALTMLFTSQLNPPLFIKLYSLENRNSILPLSIRSRILFLPIPTSFRPHPPPQKKESCNEHSSAPSFALKSTSLFLPNIDRIWPVST